MSQRFSIHSPGWCACNPPFAYLIRFLHYVTSFTEPHNLQQLEFVRISFPRRLQNITAEHCRKTSDRYKVYFGDNTSRTPVG